MIADRLAEYARSLSYGDLPPTVVHEVKRRLLDSIGCAMSAFHAPPCRIARHLAQSIKVSDGSTVWGTTHRTLPILPPSPTAPWSVIWISTIRTLRKSRHIPRIISLPFWQ